MLDATYYSGSAVAIFRNLDPLNETFRMKLFD